MLHTAALPVHPALLLHIFRLLTICDVTWTGTNIYYPDAWLATAAVCSMVLCAEIAYIMVMQRVCFPL